MSFKCPMCGERGMLVSNSRVRKKENIVFRRRDCPSCGDRVTTIERADFGCHYLNTGWILDDRPATFVNGEGWVNHASA